MKKIKTYLSGPMTGIPRKVYLQKFDRAAKAINSCNNLKAVNPARGIGVWIYYILGRKIALLYDLWLLSHCDRIYMLFDWEESKGAKLEKAFAEANNIEIKYQMFVHN